MYSVVITGGQVNISLDDFNKMVEKIEEYEKNTYLIKIEHKLEYNCFRPTLKSTEIGLHDKELFEKLEGFLEDNRLTIEDNKVLDKSNQGYYDRIIELQTENRKAKYTIDKHLDEIERLNDKIKFWKFWKNW